MLNAQHTHTHTTYTNLNIYREHIRCSIIQLCTEFFVSFFFPQLPFVPVSAYFHFLFFPYQKEEKEEEDKEKEENRFQTGKISI